MCHFHLWVCVCNFPAFSRTYLFLRHGSVVTKRRKNSTHPFFSIIIKYPWLETFRCLQTSALTHSVIVLRCCYVFFLRSLCVKYFHSGSNSIVCEYVLFFALLRFLCTQWYFSVSIQINQRKSDKSFNFVTISTNVQWKNAIIFTWNQFQLEHVHCTNQQPSGQTHTQCKFIVPVLSVLFSSWTKCISFIKKLQFIDTSCVIDGYVHRLCSGRLPMFSCVSCDIDGNLVDWCRIHNNDDERRLLSCLLLRHLTRTYILPRNFRREPEQL